MSLEPIPGHAASIRAAAHAYRAGTATLDEMSIELYANAAPGWVSQYGRRHINHILFARKQIRSLKALFSTISEALDTYAEEFSAQQKIAKQAIDAYNLGEQGKADYQRRHQTAVFTPMTNPRSGQVDMSTYLTTIASYDSQMTAARERYDGARQAIEHAASVAAKALNPALLGDFADSSWSNARRQSMRLARWEEKRSKGILGWVNKAEEFAPLPKQIPLIGGSGTFTTLTPLGGVTSALRLAAADTGTWSMNVRSVLQDRTQHEGDYDYWMPELKHGMISGGITLATLGLGPKPRPSSLIKHVDNQRALEAAVLRVAKNGGAGQSTKGEVRAVLEAAGYTSKGVKSDKALLGGGSREQLNAMVEDIRLHADVVSGVNQSTPIVNGVLIPGADKKLNELAQSEQSKPAPIRLPGRP